jgi:hypothetical protein
MRDVCGGRAEGDVVVGSRGEANRSMVSRSYEVFSVGDGVISSRDID